MSETITFSSQRVVFPDRVKPATLTVVDGIIRTIEPYREGTNFDYGGLAILPGVIDPHVHFNEPGRTEWEGWESGTKAALAGGVTNIVEMPLNSIPSTVNRASLLEKQQSTQGKLYCDVGLWGT